MHSTGVNNPLILMVISCIGILNRLFSGLSYIAGPVGCQSSFCLMKIPMLLRPVWAAQRSEAREVLCRTCIGGARPARAACQVNGTDPSAFKGKMFGYNGLAQRALRSEPQYKRFFGVTPCWTTRRAGGNM